MKIVLILAALAAVVAVYVLWVRPYLRSLPQLMDVWVQEDSLWAALKVWIDGRKTILIGVWGEVIAFLPDALQAASGFDLKTLLSLPESWAAWVTAAIPVLMAIARAQASKV